MAKQSSIFKFFTKSPPPVSNKPSPSPAEADLPSSVHRSSSSPKEEARQTQQQQSAKTSKVKQKMSPKTSSGNNKGFKKLFGYSKAQPTEDR